MWRAVGWRQRQLEGEWAGAGAGDCRGQGGAQTGGGRTAARRDGRRTGGRADERMRGQERGRTVARAGWDSSDRLCDVCFPAPAGGGGAGRVVRTPPATMGAVATVGGDACPCEEVAIDPSSAAAAIWRAEAAKFSEDTDQIYQIGRQPDSSQNVTMRQGRGGGTAEGLREWGGAMEGGCESDESSTAMGKRGRSEELHHRRR